MNICVIGLGKLGLPLAALLAANGNIVQAFDRDISLRNSISKGTFKSNEPDLLTLLETAKDNLRVLDSVSDAIDGVDLIFLIVPTPSLESGEFSNEFVLSAIREVGASVATDHKVVIDVVSTVMPGSCDGVIREELERASRRTLGPKLGLCYNPEFIALGSVIKDMSFPDMHLIGESSTWAGDVVEDALKSIVRKSVPVMRMKLSEAELVKISVNNYVTMKISFANMLLQCADRLGGIDIDVVTNAIGLDSRIGHKYLKAAAPYGGPCFPRDTRALSALYLELGLDQSLSHVTETLNSQHNNYICQQLIQNIKPSDVVGIAGISYKTGTPVTEESPGLKIYLQLRKQGVKVEFWDDEGATFIYESELKTGFKSHQDLVAKSDFIVIARPLKDPENFGKVVMGSGKPFLDLWRQLGRAGAKDFDNDFTISSS